MRSSRKSEKIKQPTAEERRIFEEKWLSVFSDENNNNNKSSSASNNNIDIMVNQLINYRAVTPAATYWRNPATNQLLPFQQFGLAWLVEREKCVEINFDTTTSAPPSSTSSLQSSLKLNRPTTTTTVPASNSYSSSSSINTANALTQAVITSTMPQRRGRTCSSSSDSDKTDLGDDDDDSSARSVSDDSSATEIEDEQGERDMLLDEDGGPTTQECLGLPDNSQAAPLTRPPPPPPPPPKPPIVLVRGRSINMENISRFFWVKKQQFYPNLEIQYINEITGEVKKRHSDVICPRGGILADEMGMGKTFQICALLTKDVQCSSSWSNPNNRPKFNPETQTTLIVAPASLLDSWKNHCELLLSEAHYQVEKIHNTSGLRIDDLNRILRTRKGEFIGASRRLIAITTYQTLVNEHKRCTRPEDVYKIDPDDDDDTVAKKKQQLEKIKKQQDLDRKQQQANGTTTTDDKPKKKKKQWYDPNYHSELFSHHFSRVVLDEAHMIKNPSSLQSKAASKLRAEVRWAVTGTPVQNKFSELYALLKFLKFSVFQEKCNWDALVSNPYKSADPAVIELFHKVMTRVCLRRTKASLFEGAKILNLPPMTVRVINLDFSKKERAIYTPMINAMKKRIATIERDSLQDKRMKKKAFVQILVMLLRARQFTSDYRLLLTNDINEEILNAKELDIHMRERLESILHHQQQERDEMIENAKLVRRNEKKLLKKERRNEDAHETIDVDADSDDQKDETRDNDGEQLVDSSSSSSSEEDSDTAATNNNHDDDDDDISTKILRQSEKQVFISEIIEEYRSFFDSINDETNTAPECPNCSNEIVLESSIALSCTHVLCGDCGTSYCPSCDELHRDEDDRYYLKHSDIVAYDKYIDMKKKKSLLMIPPNNKKPGGAKNLAHHNQPNIKTRIDELTPGTKCKNVVDYIKHNVFIRHDQKCVVFSCWPRMLQFIADHLEETSSDVKITSRNNHNNNNYNSSSANQDDERKSCSCYYTVLTGSNSIAERDVAVRSFQNDPLCRIIFVSTHAGGVGLTLTAAQHCVMTDAFWNPSIDKQAIMRVHRISQKSPVTVVRFFVNESVDRRIIQLQIQKQKLINLTVDAGRKIAEEDEEMMRQLKDAIKYDENEEGMIASSAGGINLAELKKLFD